ncbi:hypothetical protein [Moorena sp. SIO4G3]|uniref:hypothetical protein n=1 Tax=Moorena sp. SIO4G3 TaxID=2607821 RepID=UPI00142C381E|nr:hypothetical protein [Moorena sp. SIO4G3]NEO79722.1 hypothetical protein [Moorena sp. SIO4G3]
MHLQQDISQWVALRDGFRGLRGGKSEAFRPGHTLLTFLFSIPDSRFPIPCSRFPGCSAIATVLENNGQCEEFFLWARVRVSATTAPITRSLAE